MPTGVALIQVDNQVKPHRGGARRQCTGDSACVDEASRTLRMPTWPAALEIPMDTVLYAAQALHRQGIP